ncbi:MAG TPA: hypothetical protein VL025_10095 [Thermoanaerobaculia bacterium]|nr:hypothetical protein [Thermoanaerobaculia bacterium]
MPPLGPEQARALLPYVDAARWRGNFPVGLRDGALLSLIAAGLTAEEIAVLRATAITLEGGRLHVTIDRFGMVYIIILTPDMASRLLAWVTERRLWSTDELVLSSPEGPITPNGIWLVLHRYRQEKENA